jgi:predicted nucleotidyltransferase
MDQHREVAERVGAELAGRADVLAVIIAGSVGRREHVASSDIELLVVTTENSSLEAGPRRLVDGLLTGSPAERFEAVASLTARLRAQLGPADHERIPWPGRARPGDERG